MKSTDGDEFVLTSAGGPSRGATFLICFAGFEGGGGSCDVSWLTEADVRLVIVSVVSLGNDRDGGCGAGAGGCTSGIEMFGTLLVLLG